MEEKLCTGCHGSFPVSQFPKGRRCRQCVRARQRRWMKDHPGKFRHYRKCWEARNPNHNEIYRNRCRVRENTVRGRLASLLAKARLRARRDGVPCEIDLPWLVDRYERQSGQCAATGIPLVVRPVVPKGQPRDGHWNPHGPSVDRIDLRKGYTRDNVRLTCVLWNMATNEWGERLLAEAAARFLRRQGWSLTPPEGNPDFSNAGGSSPSLVGPLNAPTADGGHTSGTTHRPPVGKVPARRIRASERKARSVRAARPSRRKPNVVRPSRTRAAIHNAAR